MTDVMRDGESSAGNAIGTAVLLAAGALLFPWADLLFVAAFGIGGTCLALGLVKEFGNPCVTDPTRCPACHCDELLRLQAGTIEGRVPLLHCRSCGEAYRWWNNTLIRDDGRCQLP